MSKLEQTPISQIDAINNPRELLEFVDALRMNNPDIDGVATELENTMSDEQRSKIIFALTLITCVLFNIVMVSVHRNSNELISNLQSLSMVLNILASAGVVAFEDGNIKILGTRIEQIKESIRNIFKASNVKADNSQPIRLEDGRESDVDASIDDVLNGTQLTQQEDGVLVK